MRVCICHSLSPPVTIGPQPRTYRADSRSILQDGGTCCHKRHSSMNLWKNVFLSFILRIFLVCLLPFRPTSSTISAISSTRPMHRMQLRNFVLLTCLCSAILFGNGAQWVMFEPVTGSIWWLVKRYFICHVDHIWMFWCYVCASPSQKCGNHLWIINLKGRCLVTDSVEFWAFSNSANDSFMHSRFGTDNLRLIRDLPERMSQVEGGDGVRP